VSNLINYDSGALTFYRESVNEIVNYDHHTAIQLAEDFVKKNGGLPSDSYLAEIVPQKTLHLDTKKEVVTGYLVTFKHEYNDISIDGYAG
jgi:hypothetical protein